MALGCGTDTDYFCLYGNTEIRAQLFSPLNIDPYEPWTPRIPYEYPEHCVERSYYPTWEINDLVYDHAAEEPSLSFNLTNLSNGNKLPCATNANESETRGSFHKAVWLDCGPEESSGEIAEGGVSGTKILFDRDYSLLGVQQTWRCLDNDTDESRIVSP